MKKSIAILVSLVLCISLVSCNSGTIVSCDYDINFVEYTDKPDFTEVIKGGVPLVPCNGMNGIMVIRSAKK